MNLARIEDAERYLRLPRDSYHRRKARFDLAGQRLRESGLLDTDVIADIGAGHQELDVCLRQDFGFRGRYVTVDAWLDGVDLEEWEPPRRYDWFTALEILEHLDDPARLVRSLQANANKGIVVTTPNPQVWDVLGMDPTHKTPVSRVMLDSFGFATSEHEFHGKYRDGLAGIWLAA